MFKQALKDLPAQLLLSTQPLRATLLLASFGTSLPFAKEVFNLDVEVDASGAVPKYEKPLRYGKLPEIHHIFKPDPKSGPVIISQFFVIAVLATVPMLLGTVGVRFCSRDGSYTNISAVGIPRCERKSFTKVSFHGTHLSRSVLRLDISHGGDILPVLLYLDAVSNASCSRRGRLGCIC